MVTSRNQFIGFYVIAHYISLPLVFYACGTTSGALLIVHIEEGVFYEKSN